MFARRVAVVLVLLAAALAASGCGTLHQGCSEVGCDSGVNVDVSNLDVQPDDMVEYRVCVEDVCREGRGQVHTVRQGEPTLTVGLDEIPDDESVAVRVTITDATGRQLADATGRGKVTVSRPNGNDCPPECRNVAVVLRGAEVVPVA